MLTVFNVGQGDALLLKPEWGCQFSKHPLLVDTGPTTKKVADHIVEDELDVLVTHSHADHIGGLARVLRNKNISNLFIPYYLPEVVEINKYLKKHSNVKLKGFDWKSILGKRIITLVSEDDELCDHLLVLNPPRDPKQFFFGKEGGEDEIQEAINILRELGIELPGAEIIEYSTPILPPGQDEDNNDDGNEYRLLARKFIHGFFIYLAGALINQKHESISYEINRLIELTANQASIVFRFEDCNGTWLFTGDADKTVFNRLINQGTDISAKYLKVPHHGSRGGLSETILEKIDPTYAIVSHKNRPFGRSRDPHPHDEIIQLLDSFKVITYYTNDVIKNKQPIRTAAVGVTKDGAITFFPIEP